MRCGHGKELALNVRLNTLGDDHSADRGHPRSPTAPTARTIGCRLALILENSSTSQMILERGRLETARAFVIGLGGERCGPPTPEVTAAGTAIPDTARLERMLRRAVTTNTRHAVLAIE